MRKNVRIDPAMSHRKDVFGANDAKGRALNYYKMDQHIVRIKICHQISTWGKFNRKCYVNRELNFMFLM